jgi:hypothetical protein
MQRLLLWVGLAALVSPLAIGAVACDRRANAPTGKRSPGVASQVVEDLGPLTQAEIREAQVRRLEAGLELLKWRMDHFSSDSATVSTEREGYGVARTQFGPFTVANRGVTPYLDGFKVKLAIGNLTSATFHGVKLTVTWGLQPRGEFDDVVAPPPPPGYSASDVIPVTAPPATVTAPKPPPGFILDVPPPPDGSGVVPVKPSAAKVRTFDLTNVLSPGADSIVEVALTPAKPKEIKSVTVGLELNLMSLRRW